MDIMVDKPVVTYAGPASVSEAVELLASSDDAKVVAGCQSLGVFLRQRLIEPSLLVGLKRIPELSEIVELPGGGLRIGAMVTQRTLETSGVVRQQYPALSDAAALIASPPVRQQGTIGGNLCHADPTGDPPAVLIALGAGVELVSSTGTRRVPVEDFFVDYMETVLAADELLVAVHLPAPAANSGAAYLKHRVRGVDTALVAAGVALTLAEDGKTIREARIGLAGAGPTPLRARAAEMALAGAAPTSETFAAAGEAAAAESDPLEDTEGSAWYRREMIARFVQRAADAALRRAQGV
ncbi:MAG: xanthine dehydrogenase family protein subunit M [Chloroflexota bacterium]|nr:xanthine dehydrogenase family protein subunit M [Chloroflexota bacterium]